MLVLTDFVVALAEDGRISDGFPASLFPIGLSGRDFLGGEVTPDCTLSPGTILYLGDGRFNLDGLTLSSDPRAGERDEATDWRAFEGRRS